MTIPLLENVLATLREIEQLFNDGTVLNTSDSNKMQQACNAISYDFSGIWQRKQQSIGFIYWDISIEITSGCPRKTAVYF